MRLSSTTYFTILGFLFSIPISFKGISANYLYLLLPFFLAFIQQSYITFRFSHCSQILLALFFSIFVISLSILSISGLPLEPSAFGGALFFATYIIPFLVRLKPPLLHGLIAGVLLFSIFYSIFSMISYLALGVFSTEAKDLVGSQRTGFLLLFSLFYLSASLLFDYADALPRILAGRSNTLISILILLIGSLLTFSRSSVIALICTLVMFLFVYRRQVSTDVKLNPKLIISLAILLIMPVSFVVIKPLTALFDFYSHYLFASYLFDPDSLHSDLGNELSSGGTRLAIIKFSIGLIMDNPIIGNSFSGISRITPWGSFHNQYFDIIVRSGIVLGGFILGAFIAILFRFTFHPLTRLHHLAASSFASTLIYGFFHETFRESQGAFLLLLYVQIYLQPSHKYRVNSPFLYS